MILISSIYMNSFVPIKSVGWRLVLILNLRFFIYMYKTRKIYFFSTFELKSTVFELDQLIDIDSMLITVLSLVFITQ